MPGQAVDAAWNITTIKQQVQDQSGGQWLDDAS